MRQRVCGCGSTAGEAAWGTCLRVWVWACPWVKVFWDVFIAATAIMVCGPSQSCTTAAPLLHHCCWLRVQVNGAGLQEEQIAYICAESLKASVIYHSVSAAQRAFFPRKPSVLVTAQYLHPSALVPTCVLVPHRVRCSCSVT